MEKKSNGKLTLRIIISILVAVAVWIYVDVGQGTTVKTTLRDVPVEFSGENGVLADRGLMLISGYDATIDLRIEGPRRELWKLGSGSVRIVADTSSITETGVQALNYDVVFPDNVSRSDLKLDWRSAYTVTVTVGELYTKEIPVYCDLQGSVAGGYLTEAVELDPVNLVLRGQRDDLLNVSYAKVELDVSGANKTIIQGVAYQLYDYNDIVVSNDNIRADVSMIQVTLPIKTTSVVPLRLLFEEAPGSTAATMEYTILPASVTLVGEREDLEKIDSIVLDTIYLQDLDASQTLNYTISVPDNTSLADEVTQATVTIVVSGVEERSLTVSEFLFENIPDGYAAVALTDSIRVTLRGLSSEIAALDTENVTVTADLRQLSGAGSYTVPVKVSVKGYSNVSAKGSYQIMVTLSPASEPTNGPDGQ